MSLTDRRRLLLNDNNIVIPTTGLISEYLFENNLNNSAPSSTYTTGTMTTTNAVTYTTGPGGLNAIR